MSKPSARTPTIAVSGYETSKSRVAASILLALLGIAWLTVYTVFAMDHANFTGPGKAPSTPLPWMSDLHKWNYVIGFLLIAVALVISAHPKHPLGRGRGVVVGMLGCMLLGLVWIVTYYFVGSGSSGSFHIPVMDQLGQGNLVVGIGAMAVGFTFATKWE